MQNKSIQRNRKKIIIKTVQLFLNNKSHSINKHTFSATYPQMQVQPVKYTGLVADLMPNIRLMQAFGNFIFKYSSTSVLIRKIYAGANLSMFLLQFFLIMINMALNTSEVNELTANTVTTLHFTHCMTKIIYIAVNSKNFYKLVKCIWITMNWVSNKKLLCRTFNIWNTCNTHPLFAESDARYHAISLAKSRKLLYMVSFSTLASVLGK